MYVWMDYPQYNFQYPSEDYESDDTQYFNSPYTRWPDFTNSEALECGGTLDHVSIVGVDAWEGLCLFVRSPYLTEEDELLQVRFAYHDGVTDLDTNTNPLSVRPCLVMLWKHRPPPPPPPPPLPSPPFLRKGN